MSYDKHQATLEFSRWSDSYDRCILQWMLFGPSHRVLIGRIRAVSRGRPIRMLDVGCGTGCLRPRFGRPCPKSKSSGSTWWPRCWPKGIRGGSCTSGHVLPVQGDSERLPFSSASFDIVTCANSFHHYPAPGTCRRGNAPGSQAWWPIDDH